jgi:hypothetical protein
MRWPRFTLRTLLLAMLALSAAFYVATQLPVRAPTGSRGAYEWREPDTGDITFRLGWGIFLTAQAIVLIVLKRRQIVAPNTDTTSLLDQN